MTTTREATSRKIVAKIKTKYIIAIQKETFRFAFRTKPTKCKETKLFLKNAYLFDNFYLYVSFQEVSGPCVTRCRWW